MTHNRDRHHRRSIRMPGYGYAQPGAYFLTLCTHERANLFGEITGGVMQPNAAGEIVRAEWFQSAAIRQTVELFDDEFVVMPNHIHGIVWIVDAPATAVGATGRSPLPSPQPPPCPSGSSQPQPLHQLHVSQQPSSLPPPGSSVVTGVGATGRSPLHPATLRPGSPIRPNGPQPGSIGAVMAGFKSACTKRINEYRKTPGVPVWQRNYYEHIIRNESALHGIRQYILDNPAQWALDRENIGAHQP